MGRLAYRGYFPEQSARKLEHYLSRQGYDTCLYGVSVYSAPGWFTDSGFRLVDFPQADPGFGLPVSVLHHLKELVNLSPERRLSRLRQLLPPEHRARNHAETIRS